MAHGLVFMVGLGCKFGLGAAGAYGIRPFVVDPEGANAIRPYDHIHYEFINYGFPRVNGNQNTN